MAKTNIIFTFLSALWATFVLFSNWPPDFLLMQNWNSVLIVNQFPLLTWPLETTILFLNLCEFVFYSSFVKFYACLFVTRLFRLAQCPQISPTMQPVSKLPFAEGNSTECMDPIAFPSSVGRHVGCLYILDIWIMLSMSMNLRCIVPFSWLCAKVVLQMKEKAYF